MKQLKKKRVLQLAEEANLVYNTELENFQIFPWHAKALYDFYLLIEKEMKQDEETNGEV